MNTTGLDLAGTLQLRPGCAPPGIRSTRPLLAPRLARGLAAHELAQRLASVYTLCGGAHRVAARLALAAATTGTLPPDGAHAARELATDTLREHLRRIVLDWPAPLAGERPSTAELTALREGLRPVDAPRPVARDARPSARAEPADASGAPPAAAAHAARACVEQALLGEDAVRWLSAWDRDPDTALERWSARAATPTARRLRTCRAAARALAQPVRRLEIAGDAQALAGIAAALRADPDFARAPRWPGAGFESGCWARAADPAPARYGDAWLRLGARLAEAARLTLPDADGRALRLGALALATDAGAAGGHAVDTPAAAPQGASCEGLGWCETARGLLLHRVRLQRAGAHWRVAACDVLAPTEWHFHPAGPVAELLARLPRRGSDAAARLLAAAFDPCVAVRVETGDA